MSGNIKMLNDDNFAQEIANGITLVDFFAEWCGPCKMLAPIIEQLSNEVPEGTKICKLNIDEAEKTTALYRVMSVPTIMIFRDGQFVDIKVGLTSKADLMNMLVRAGETSAKQN